MALTATVAKESVKLVQTGLYNINLTLTVTDTEGLGFVKLYSARYRPGDNVANKTAALIATMNADIATYKAQETVLNSTALTNAVATINAGLVV